MQVAMIGLGLIGGSMAKAIRIHTQHQVYGYDINESVILKAKLLEAIDDRLTDNILTQADMILIALYPRATVDYIREHAHLFRKDALVIDCCGVKDFVCAEVTPIAEAYGFTFLGGHPMAGRERSGFDAAQGTLFQNASMILTPTDTSDPAFLEKVGQFFLSIGFGSITVRSPKDHDRVISYTSQLAHILSNAYIKSPTADEHRGLSAGSFRDMTRVATMNVPMWSELFFCNKEPLLTELNGLIDRLSEYRDALQADDKDTLESLLRAGDARNAKILEGDATK